MVCPAYVSAITSGTQNPRHRSTEGTCVDCLCHLWTNPISGPPPCHAVPLPAGVQQRIFVHDFQSVLKDGGPHQQQKQNALAAAAGNSRAAGPAIAGTSGGGAGAGDGSSSGNGVCAPRLDLATGSKISCVSFSPAVQQYLLSSDYTGVVQLWDLTGRGGW